MKNTISFFVRNRKIFRLINETEIRFINRFVTTKRNETKSKRNSLTALSVSDRESIFTMIFFSLSVILTETVFFFNFFINIGTSFK
jgi:hypothetical protein